MSVAKPIPFALVERALSLWATGQHASRAAAMKAARQEAQRAAAKVPKRPTEAGPVLFKED